MSALFEAIGSLAGALTPGGRDHASSWFGGAVVFGIMALVIGGLAVLQVLRS